jgi:dTDP-4-dehydrorhamnose reductase
MRSDVLAAVEMHNRIESTAVRAYTGCQRNDEDITMRLLLTGASGQLGGYLLQALAGAPDEVIAWSGSRGGTLLGHPLQPVDLADPAAVADNFAEARPDVVLHAGAWARVADCFRAPEQARRINVDGTATLCALAEQTGVRVVFVSTDMVFDGEQAPYREEDVPAPLSVYGRTKADAETVVRQRPENVVVRLSLLVGPSVVGRPSYYDEQVQTLRQGQPLKLFVDEWRTPLALADAARALLVIARSDVRGVLHVGGPERLSRLEMGRRLAAEWGLSEANLVPIRRDDLPGLEPRPRDVSLDSTRWRSLDRPSRV